MLPHDQVWSAEEAKCQGRVPPCNGGIHNHVMGHSFHGMSFNEYYQYLIWNTVYLRYNIHLFSSHLLWHRTSFNRLFLKCFYRFCLVAPRALHALIMYCNTFNRVFYSALTQLGDLRSSEVSRAGAFREGRWQTRSRIIAFPQSGEFCLSERIDQALYWTERERSDDEAWSCSHASGCTVVVLGV